MNKILVALGAALLLASVLPTATAHLTNTNGSIIAGLGGDPCRASDADGDGTCTATSGVSGNYVTADGGVPTVLGPNLYVHVGDLDGDEQPGITVNDDTTLFAAGFASTGAALCDFEVLSSGSPDDESDPKVVDEEKVDNADGGSVPDGTLDDGGIGAACHTGDHYEKEGYNTADCAGTAYASDFVLEGAVWIGAGCDYQTTVGAVNVRNCLVNEVLSFNPDTFADEVSECVAEGTSGAPGTVDSCSTDGVTDSIVYGAGSAGLMYPSSNCNPATTPNTNDDDGANVILSNVVFVFNYVNVDATVLKSTVGWIDTPGV